MNLTGHSSNTDVIALLPTSQLWNDPRSHLFNIFVKVLHNMEDNWNWHYLDLRLAVEVWFLIIGENYLASIKQIHIGGSWRIILSIVHKTDL